MFRYFPSCPSSSTPPRLWKRVPLNRELRDRRAAGRGMAVTHWRNRAAISIQSEEEGCRKARLGVSNNRRKGAGKRSWETPTTGGRVPESEAGRLQQPEERCRKAQKTSYLPTALDIPERDMTEQTDWREKATITRGLRLGRSEVLRSLRHYLPAQSQEHHIQHRSP